MSGIQQGLREAMRIQGALSAAFVDYLSRFTLAAVQGPRGPDLSQAADGNTDVVRAKLATLELLGYRAAQVEDMVITLDREYHVLRLINQRARQGVYFYLVLDRGHADLSAARQAMAGIARRLDI